MFYIKLFENSKLAAFSVSEKNKIINLAIKKSRKDFPLDIKKRAFTLFGIVIVPMLIIHSVFSFEGALPWLLLSTFALNFRMATIETPNIEPYLDSAITEFVNQA